MIDEHLRKLERDFKKTGSLDDRLVLARELYRIGQVQEFDALFQPVLVNDRTLQEEYFTLRQLEGPLNLIETLQEQELNVYFTPLINRRAKYRILATPSSIYFQGEPHIDILDSEYRFLKTLEKLEKEGIRQANVPNPQPYIYTVHTMKNGNKIEIAYNQEPSKEDQIEFYNHDKILIGQT